MSKSGFTRLLHLDVLFANHGVTYTVMLTNCYCVFQGGMKAVVWTDVFQAIVMIGGLLAIVVQVSICITPPSLFLSLCMITLIDG